MSNTLGADALAGIINDVWQSCNTGSQTTDPNASSTEFFELSMMPSPQLHIKPWWPYRWKSEVIANIRKRAAEDVHTLAEMAQEETGLGRVEDKMKKSSGHSQNLVPNFTAHSLHGRRWTCAYRTGPLWCGGLHYPLHQPTETIINNG